MIEDGVIAARPEVKGIEQFRNRAGEGRMMKDMTDFEGFDISEDDPNYSGKSAPPAIGGEDPLWYVASKRILGMFETGHNPTEAQVNLLKNAIVQYDLRDGILGPNLETPQQAWERGQAAMYESIADYEDGPLPLYNHVRQDYAALAKAPQAAAPEDDLYYCSYTSDSEHVPSQIPGQCIYCGNKGRPHRMREVAAAPESKGEHLSWDEALDQAAVSKNTLPDGSWIRATDQTMNAYEAGYACGYHAHQSLGSKKEVEG